VPHRDDGEGCRIVTEEIAATPGWVDGRLDELFAALPAGEAVASARDAYADCLAGQKEPVAPSDNLGTEFGGCRARLRAALAAADVTGDDWTRLDAALEALEAEIAAES